MSRSARFGLVAATLLLALWLAVGWLGSGYVLRPPWYPGVSPDGTLPAVAGDAFGGIHTDPHTEFGIAFEDVAFPAEDGQTLRGWFVPGAVPAEAGDASEALSSELKRALDGME